MNGFHCRWINVLIAGAVCIALVSVQRGHAADTVVVKTASGDEKRRGEIVDYTGQALTLRLAGGREETISADSIRTIETARLPEQTQGDALFAEGKIAEAIEQYRVAGKKEPRRWVQRELLAAMARAYLEAGNVEKAGASFLVLLRSDPETPYFEAIPLSWRSSEPPPALVKQGQAWMAQTDSPAAQLLGASWLLPTANRPECLTLLQKLAAGQDRRVAMLAETQLWRTRFVAATAADVVKWKTTIAGLPEPLRAGPFFLLGKAQARLEQPEAAVTFLRVPILYGSARGLAAESLFAAGQELVRRGQAAEAARVFEELAVRFPESPLAEAARERRQTVENSPAKSEGREAP